MVAAIIPVKVNHMTKLHHYDEKPSSSAKASDGVDVRRARLLLEFIKDLVNEIREMDL
ncbi:MAG: hypothetical protein AB7P97_06775 [Hyphomonadaceae bacterium]